MRKLIELGAKCELARRDFFFYCHIKSPQFYKENRKYLKEFCDDLQDFYFGDDEVLVCKYATKTWEIKNSRKFC